MKIILSFFLIAAFIFGATLTSGASTSIKKVQKYRENHEHQIIKEFMELLSIPNVSSDTVNIRKNAEFIQSMMEKRGIQTRVMETQGNPIVYGELNNPQSTQTYLFYVHYDGQPVDPEEWTDTHPFEPALRPGKLKSGTCEPKPIPFPEPGEKFKKDWRIYARGSSDDRAPIIGLLTAIDIRMVKGNEPDDMRQKVIDHIKEEGYHVVSQTPDHKTRMTYEKIAKVMKSEVGYKAYKTPMDSPLVQEVIHSVTQHCEQAPVLLPSLGGSLPIYLFHETLSVPIIGLPITNHDNNQHQPDENFRIGHLWTGIETYTAIIIE